MAQIVVNMINGGKHTFKGPWANGVDTRVAEGNDLNFVLDVNDETVGANNTRRRNKYLDYLGAISGTATVNWTNPNNGASGTDVERGRFRGVDDKGVYRVIFGDQIASFELSDAANTTAEE